MVIDSDNAASASINKMWSIQGCEVLSFPIGSAALMTARSYTPDLILLADNVDDADGFELCRNLKILTECKNIPIIFMNETAEGDGKTRAFDAGADDVIAKPLHFTELRNKIALHLKLSTHLNKAESHKMLEKQIKDVSDAQLATIFALAKLAEQRDGDTGAHLERVREYCRVLAE